MRRFRQSLKDPEYRLFDPSYDTKQLKDQVHLLTVLDSCSQILRDDRIWLRKRIKDNDPQVIAILKVALKGQKQINLVNIKQLQINLRKYIHRVKELQRQQQLIKFKENVLANEFKRKKGKQMQTVGTNNSWKNLRIQQKRHNESSYSLPRQQSFLSRVPEPIEEQNSSDKQSSHPSRSSEPFSHYQRQSNRSSFVFRRDEDKIHGYSRRSSNEKQIIDIYGGRQSLHVMKQSKSNGMLRSQKIGSFDKTNKIPSSKEWQKERNILKDMKLDTFRQKEELMTFKPSQSIQSIDTVQKPHKKSSLNQFQISYSPFESVSATPNHCLDKSDYNMISISQSKPSNITHINRASLPARNQEKDQDLFTSPELLMQCRLFIERNSTNSKRRKEVDSTETKQLVTCLQNKLNQQRQSQKPQQSIQQNIIKQIQQKEQVQCPFVIQSKVIPRLSIKSPTQFTPVKKRTIQNQYQQNIFDVIFGSKTIVTNFHQLLEQNYELTPTLQNLINRTGNEILYQQLGPLLQVYCPLKHTNNPIRDVYNYIDLDKNGYFTLEDLEAFLSQVFQSEEDPVYKLAMSIFDKTQKDGKVQYWSLYQIKQSDDIKQFVSFLSQFEFQVEA